MKIKSEEEEGGGAKKKITKSVNDLSIFMKEYFKF